MKSLERKSYKYRKNSPLKYTTTWRFKKGVFLSPNGKWIVRVKSKTTNCLTTISQHRTKEEAQKVYDDFYAT